MQGYIYASVWTLGVKHTYAIQTVHAFQSLRLTLFSVFTASSDGQVEAWEVSSGNCKKVFKGHDYEINCMLVSKLFVEFYSMVTIMKGESKICS